jgi:multidrug transporter EmrE-like cation transporter
MFSHWDYVLPLAINFSGSVFFLAGLATNAVSIAVPVTNSLKFVFTSVAGYVLLGESPGTWKTYLGLVCIITGTTICIHATLPTSS